MAKKKGGRSRQNQFILGALVGAAATYFLLQQRGASMPPPPPIRPGIPTLPGGVISMDEIGELPKFMFRPRTKLYL
jgi:hypothetical protein